MNFGERLKDLRIQRNYSMDKFIELFNEKYFTKMNKSTLSRYENGIQDPIYTVVVNIADFFGVSVDYLTGRNSDNFVTFPVIGDVAAGYNHIANEEMELLNIFRQLTAEGKEKIKIYAEDISELENYRSHI